MKLSHRLEIVASFVSEGSNLADIGTDHGYIPIYLVEQGIVPRAIAMDVRTGPLKRADSHIREHGLEHQIQTRLSDGLEKLEPGEADTVVIAGMGGELIIHILEAGAHVRDSIREWVLSPQSALEQVRRYLQEHGLAIVQETMLCEDGKYYTVMKAVPGKMALCREIEWKYGKDLLDQKHPVLLEFLEKEERLLTEVLTHLAAQDTDGARQRKAEILKELDIIKEAQHEMQTAD
ncbi:MAG: tRNA (adenine(22)-N(1))-methyltransferase [Lachnospiraceae bacterium]